MPKIYHIACPHARISGSIRLDGSKSISNRVLIIQALSGTKFDISGLSESHDTQILTQMLTSENDVLDAGHAGTSFRFSTAFFALGKKEKVITGSERMKQRPIGPLVDALNLLGAQIEYTEIQGYPPLRILPTKTEHWKDEVKISGGVSSQYISALLMIGSVLPKGLSIILEGSLVSRPYIEMTIRIMSFFGAKVNWEGNKITVSYAPYIRKPFQVEADWSAASYYYGIAAFARTANILLKGLQESSLQGDQQIINILEPFGVSSTFQDGNWIIKKNGPLKKTRFHIDFTTCPDIAQTIAVISAGLQLPIEFSGLQTLAIKETDRIRALQNELSKINCTFHHVLEDENLPYQHRRYQTGGNPNWKSSPTFETYKDHRMAMAFAPLALLKPINISDPDVVRKSYPAFWNDLKKLGFDIKEKEE
jgi:3-phosphoshikimate 1-carboxyvinyltransferase